MFFSSLNLAYAPIIGKPIGFEVIMSDVSATVGKPVDISVTVKNLGFLTDNYTVELGSTFPPQALNVIIGSSRIENVPPISSASNPIGQTNLRILALFTTGPTNPIKIRIDVKSEVDSIIDPLSNIVLSKEINVRAGEASLSDFDNYSIIQILIISSVFLIITFRRKT